MYSMKCGGDSMSTIEATRKLSNEALLREVETLAAREIQVTVELLLYLGELDLRKLYLELGYSSLCRGQSPHSTAIEG